MSWGCGRAEPERGCVHWSLCTAGRLGSQREGAVWCVADGGVRCSTSGGGRRIGLLGAVGGAMEGVFDTGCAVDGVGVVWWWRGGVVGGMCVLGEQAVCDSPLGGKLVGLVFFGGFCYGDVCGGAAWVGGSKLAEGADGGF